MSLTLLSSCEKDFDIDVDNGEPQLVVEAYINNEMPAFNYVLLSRSQNYYAPNFQSVPVSNAVVSITEGVQQPDHSYTWDATSKVLLTEQNLDTLPVLFNKGAYFDSRAFTNPVQALMGHIGKSYLLEIQAEGKNYSAITKLIEPVLIDSITFGFPFVDDSMVDKVRLTNNYKDPDTIGNVQFYFWKYNDRRNNFGWGGYNKSRLPATDDLSNGQYIRLTHPQAFGVGDSVIYHMASITRDVYNFWETFNKARDNNGPFSTPVVLQTNITGDRVTGCFSGYSLTTKFAVAR